MEQNPYEAPQEPSDDEPNKSRLIVAADILLLLAIVVIAGWMLFDNSHKARESAELDARSGS